LNDRRYRLRRHVVRRRARIRHGVRLHVRVQRWRGDCRCRHNRVHRVRKAQQVSTILDRSRNALCVLCVVCLWRGGGAGENFLNTYFL